MRDLVWAPVSLTLVAGRRARRPSCRCAIPGSELAADPRCGSGAADALGRDARRTSAARASGCLATDVGDHALLELRQRSPRAASPMAEALSRGEAAALAARPPARRSRLVADPPRRASRGVRPAAGRCAEAGSPAHWSTIRASNPGPARARDMAPSPAWRRKRAICSRTCSTLELARRAEQRRSVALQPARAACRRPARPADPA